MVMLAVNQAHSTTDPMIVVENKLEPGKYRFRLVVLDEAKNASVPSEIVVEVAPKKVGPVIPDVRISPDLVFNPGIIKKPVFEPVTEPIIKPVNPGINPGILRPGRFTRPGG